MIPKRKATQFAIVNLIHCRRIRRRDLLAKGRLPTSSDIFRQDLQNLTG
ncbi:MAG: hypothetical protein LBK82_04120 [Planctomycetaceae bacterium]|nr:hypothetical protein [Planctomycetaceae bacterium]